MKTGLKSVLTHVVSLTSKTKEIFKRRPNPKPAQVKCQVGSRRDSRQSHMGSQVGMVGSCLSHLGWKFDPTRDPPLNAGFQHLIRDLRWDFYIPPRILVGLTHPTRESRCALCIPPGILFRIRMSYIPPGILNILPRNIPLLMILGSFHAKKW